MRYILVSILVLMTGCGYGIDSGTGKKIGRVVKMGHYGMFCGTYEGELVRGGFNDGSGVNGTSFDFSVKKSDKPLYERLLKVMEEQKEIEVDYVKAALSGPCSGNASVWVTDFRELKPPAALSDAEKAKKMEELQKQLEQLK